MKRSAAFTAMLIAATAFAVRETWPGQARLVANAAGEIRVDGATDLQSALDSAVPGQTIVLEAGQVYRGPFHLPAKTGADWITIRTSSARLASPATGQRVSPADAPDMPKLTASDTSVLIADPGAHHYRFVGLDIAPEPGIYLVNVIDLGTGTTAADSVPHDFDFEHCYVHGDPTAGSRRGFALNSATTTIADSYVSDFKEVGEDSQAICGWNGPGPYTITNNYLEGAGENLMFGGADPTLLNNVPSNIEIRGNHFAKPGSWRQSQPPTPQQAATPHWSVKNLLELKNAQHVLIDGNVLEFNWLDSQVGFAILFTPRNQDGASPWSTVADVTFSHNIVRHVAAAMDLLGHDDIHDSQPSHDIHIVNNLFVDIGGSWGFGRLFQLLNGTTNVTIDHNTGLQTETPVFGGDTRPHTGFVFQNNIVPHNTYGFIGSGTAPGAASIAQYFPGAIITHNVIAGGDASALPADNFYPASLNDVGFVNLAAGDFHLSPNSPYRRKATDGADVGADIDAIATATVMAVLPTDGVGGDTAGPKVGGPHIAGPRGASLVMLRLLAGDGRRAAAKALVLWSAFALVVYIYVGYPWLVAYLARRRPHPARTAPYEPTVTLLVVAWNEAERIADRIENLRAQDYPAERRTIVVVSDGSTDDTAARARAAGSDVVVIERSVRQGKPAAFNDVLPRLSSEVVVFCDARQRFAPGAVRALVAHFADPKVGAVSGRLLLTPNADAGAGSQGVEAYWDYEARLRWRESLIDSTIGVTGAIAAARRDLVPEIPADTILDDVLIPMRIARKGYRVTFEPAAVAHDRLATDGRSEFRRKIRTLAGNFQLFVREPWLFVPWRNRLWVQTISHKALRLVLPVLFDAIVTATVALAAEPLYRLMLAGEVLFFALALAGGAWPSFRRQARWLVLPYAVCFLACATVVGFVRFVTGRQRATWDRVAAPAPMPSDR